MDVPMVVIMPVKDRAANIADVPEFGTAVVSAGGHVILSIGVEIQVSYGFHVSVFYVVNRPFVD